MEQELHRKISDSAILFRRTIEQMDITEFPQSGCFERSPLGCCGDCSKLMTKYLLEQHYVKALYVWGMRGEQSHAWLEYDGLIIDITADQFDEVTEPVIITIDRAWYSQLEGQNPKFLDFDTFLK
ncbi:hypothetical protein NSS79_15140 [Paenibacillus sp. FSL L8-0436]|uniref:hypothetical protein n=1 Tax=Paenibacillus sp. FSL L8-0436 TaxID=2954686 RepID=UPI0031594FB9